MRTTCLVLLALLAPAGAAELGVSVVNAAGAPLQNAVVWLVPVAGKAPAPGSVHVRIDQQQRRFVPLVSVLQAGSLVDFPNSDDIRHSVYSFSEAKPFTLKLYSGRPSAPVLFDKPGIVLLGCNIHDTMVAWVAVVDSPWFAQTDASGHLAIKAVPEGQYTLQAWHPGQAAPFVAHPVSIQASNEPLSLRIDATDVHTLLASTDPKQAEVSHP